MLNYIAMNFSIAVMIPASIPAMSMERTSVGMEMEKLFAVIPTTISLAFGLTVAR